MEDQVQSREEEIAAAEAAVTQATEAVEKAEAAAKSGKAGNDNKEALKEAKANAKQAKQYRAGLKDDDVGVAEADETQQGWEAEVERLQGVVDDEKESDKALREHVKTAKAELKEAKKALTAAKKVAKPKVEREKQNGITRPVDDGGPSFTVWSLADSAQERLGRAPGLGDILADAEEVGVKTATARAAYAHWRKFHGVTGRVESAEQIEAREAKEREKAEKEAARAKAAAEKATADA